MPTGHCSEFLWRLDAHERHEGLDVALVGTPGLGAGEIGKPLRFWRHISQAVELRLGQQAGSGILGSSGQPLERGFTGQGINITVHGNQCSVSQESTKRIKPPGQTKRLNRSFRWTDRRHPLAHLCTQGIRLTRQSPGLHGFVRSLFAGRIQLCAQLHQ